MSSSSPEPPEPLLSIVVGSNGAPGAVEACLAALEGQTDGCEVIVPERPGTLVPELWADGIDRAKGEIVALTISVMEPAPDWVATIRGKLVDGDVVAGAIEPGAGLRLSDWAEYFVRYARDMLPFEAHESVEIPGDNCAYRRELLERTRPLWAEGFWEPVVNRRLRDDGVRLLHTPELVVRQGRSAGAGAFVRQRFVHGRVYGRQRGARFGPARNVVGIAAAPAVAAVLALRVAGEVRRKQRFLPQLLAALPLILLFDAAWATGEALGHLDALLGRR